MDRIIGLLRLYLWNVKLGISRSMAYRVDFLIGLVTSILYSGTAPFLQYIFFTQTRGYPGWDLKQIMLFQGALLLWLGIRDMMFGNVKDVANSLVRKGDFDRLLVKPYPPLGVLLCSGFNLKGIGAVISGSVLTCYALIRLETMPNLWQILIILLLLLCSLFFYMAVTTLLCTIIIMIVQIGRIDELTERILGFGNYPINIYPKLLRQLFLTVLPFAIWAYVPAQVVLGRIESGAYTAAAGCVVLFLFSVWVWERSLSKYTSAGG